MSQRDISGSPWQKCTDPNILGLVHPFDPDTTNVNQLIAGDRILLYNRRTSITYVFPNPMTETVSRSRRISITPEDRAHFLTPVLKTAPYGSKEPTSKTWTDIVTAIQQDSEQAALFQQATKVEVFWVSPNLNGPQENESESIRSIKIFTAEHPDGVSFTYNSSNHSFIAATVGSGLTVAATVGLTYALTGAQVATTTGAMTATAGIAAIAAAGIVIPVAGMLGFTYWTWLIPHELIHTKEFRYQNTVDLSLQPSSSAETLSTELGPVIEVMKTLATPADEPYAKMMIYKLQAIRKNGTTGIRLIVGNNQYSTVPVTLLRDSSTNKLSIQVDRDEFLPIFFNETDRSALTTFFDTLSSPSQSSQIPSSSAPSRRASEVRPTGLEPNPLHSPVPAATVATGGKPGSLAAVAAAYAKADEAARVAAAQTAAL